MGKFAEQARAVIKQADDWQARLADQEARLHQAVPSSEQEAVAKAKVILENLRSGAYNLGYGLRNTQHENKGIEQLLPQPENPVGIPGREKVINLPATTDKIALDLSKLKPVLGSTVSEQVGKAPGVPGNAKRLYWALARGLRDNPELVSSGLATAGGAAAGAISAGEGNRAKGALVGGALGGGVTHGTNLINEDAGAPVLDTLFGGALGLSGGRIVRTLNPKQKQAASGVEKQAAGYQQTMRRAKALAKMTVGKPVHPENVGAARDLLQKVRAGYWRNLYRHAVVDIAGGKNGDKILQGLRDISGALGKPLSRFQDTGVKEIGKQIDAAAVPTGNPSLLGRWRGLVRGVKGRVSDAASSVQDAVSDATSTAGQAPPSPGELVAGGAILGGGLGGVGGYASGYVKEKDPAHKGRAAGLHALSGGLSGALAGGMLAHVSDGISKLKLPGSEGDWWKGASWLDARMLSKQALLGFLTEPIGNKLEEMSLNLRKTLDERKQKATRVTSDPSTLPSFYPAAALTVPNEFVSGYRAADKTQQDKMRTEMDQRLEHARKEFETALSDEYSSSHAKSASALIDGLAQLWTGELQVKQADGELNQLLGTYLAGAGLLGVGAHHVVKGIVEKRDPRYQRLKAMKELIRQRQRHSPLPVLVTEEHIPAEGLAHTEQVKPDIPAAEDQPQLTEV